MKGAVWVVALITLGGCQPGGPTSGYQPPSGPGPAAAPPADPDGAVSEQLRAGAVQLAAAGATIQDALASVRSLASRARGDVKTALEGAADYVDSAGSTAADAASDPPSDDEVRADFQRADDDRKRRIEAGEDAYRDLSEARGILDALSEQGPQYGACRELIEVAMDDVEEAVTAFGGKIVLPEDEPPPGG